VIVDCALYRDGRRQNTGPLALEETAQLCVEDNGFVWLGLFEPDDDELADVQGRFGLHDLAVEDAQNFHLRPKIERYEEGGVLFAVFHTARYVEEREEVDVGEVSVFLLRRFVITVRQGVASDLHGARLRLEERPALLREGTAAILWAIAERSRIAGGVDNAVGPPPARAHGARGAAGADPGSIGRSQTS
jgi:magnesium transporter